MIKYILIKLYKPHVTRRKRSSQLAVAQLHNKAPKALKNLGSAQKRTRTPSARIDGSHVLTRRHARARKSRIISRAALWPGAPLTPPPGWVEAPHMYKPGIGER